MFLFDMDLSASIQPLCLSICGTFGTKQGSKDIFYVNDVYRQHPSYVALPKISVKNTVFVVLNIQNHFSCA